MSTTAQRFDAFISNIQLTEKQIDDAITKHTGVRRTLHKAFYTTTSASKTAEDQMLEALGVAIDTVQLKKSYAEFEVAYKALSAYSTSLLVGSYGKNTDIAPPSDIDILFKMPLDRFTAYDTASYNGQSKLLQDVKKVLQQQYQTTDGMRGDGQVVVVPFASFPVEVLPAFEAPSGKFLYPDTHDGGSWKITDPKAEIAHLSSSNKRTKGNTIRLIKMMKAWKLYRGVKIKSLVIELHVVDFLNRWEHFDKSSTYYDWMVRDFLSDLLRYTNGSSLIPGLNERAYYGDAWKAEAERALTKATSACENEAGNYPTLATNDWKEIFGQRFNY